MSTYLRFQTNVVRPHAGHPLGIFRATGLLEDEGRIDTFFHETLAETLAWYNDHLRVPRISRKHHRCIFWFRTDRQRFVTRLWDLVALLAEHHVVVRRVKTSDPGIVVYRDEYQVAAMPSRRVYSELRL